MKKPKIASLKKNISDILVVNFFKSSDFYKGSYDTILSFCSEIARTYGNIAFFHDEIYRSKSYKNQPLFHNDKK